MSETAASPAAAPAVASATNATTATASAATAAAQPQAATGTPAPAPSAHDVQQAAIALASRQERAEQLAAAGLPPEENAPPAQGQAAEQPKDKAPAEKGKDDKPKVEDKSSPTARIAALAAENRQHKAALKSMEAKLAEIQSASTTTAAEAKLLADVRAALKKDPLDAFKLLNEEWREIVNRVADKGVPPTPEQQAAAAAKAEAEATAARIKKLEEEREAEKTEAQKAADTRQRAAAVNYVTTKMITAEKYPVISRIANEAAAEALDMVNEAVETAYKAGKRQSPMATPDEAEAMVYNALAGLEKHYTEQITRLGGSIAAQQPAATQEAPAAQAQPAAPAVSLIDQANSQQRGPETLTPSVVARLPPATQTRVMSADDARRRAMEQAALLPPLS